MSIVPWPLVTRNDLVRAFKPGTDDRREAPIRTLRAHHWVSSGINVRSRSGARASGSLTFFSWLNLDAARAARRGDSRAATRIAREAARLERSAPFNELAKVLGSVSPVTATAVVHGVLTTGAPDSVDDLLRLAAVATEDSRKGLSAFTPDDAIFGKVSRVEKGFVELVDVRGSKTKLSRALAEGAHRAVRGDCLAVFSDQLGSAQLLLSASPALETSGELPRRAFAPFERTTVSRSLSAADLALLARAPRAIKPKFSVAIEE